MGPCPGDKRRMPTPRTEDFGIGRDRAHTLFEPAAGRPLWLKLAIAAVALAGVYLLARQVGAYVPLFAEWVRGLGFWGPLVFIVGYAAFSTFVPGAFLTLAGGVIFGLARGTVFVFIAAVLGSTIAFVVARYFARGAMERRFTGGAHSRWRGRRAFGRPGGSPHQRRPSHDRRQRRHRGRRRSLVL